jgi:hypothetical protein
MLATSWLTPTIARVLSVFFLREEVQFDGLALRDPLTGNAHRLSECGHAIVGMLHAGRTAEEVVAAVTGKGRFDPAIVLFPRTCRAGRRYP